MGDWGTSPDPWWESPSGSGAQDSWTNESYETYNVDYDTQYPEPTWDTFGTTETGYEDVHTGDLVEDSPQVLAAAATYGGEKVPIKIRLKGQGSSTHLGGQADSVALKKAADALKTAETARAKAITDLVSIP